MASGFFALLDDIAALMDDVVVMSKLPQNSRNLR
jgi:predicted DNA repair protein MutK